VVDVVATEADVVATAVETEVVVVATVAEATVAEAVTAEVDTAEAVTAEVDTAEAEVVIEMAEVVMADVVDTAEAEVKNLASVAKAETDVLEEIPALAEEDLVVLNKKKWPMNKHWPLFFQHS
jgi:hypothetical protein